MLARIRTVARSEVLIIGLGVCAFVAAFSYPTIAHLSRIGVVWDWTEYLQRNWVAFHSMSNFHQVPLWDPYACGGMPFLAHPESLVLTPLFALQLTFGPVVGLHLEVMAHIAIAWIGGYVLGSILGMNLLGRLTCACVFPASSWFYLHTAAGHVNFLPEAYLPWIAVMVLLAIREHKLMLWATAGLLIALMFGEGGFYQCVHAMLLAGVLALYESVKRKSMRPFLGIGAMGLFSVGFAAIKLLPSWQLMQLHPRGMAGPEYFPVLDLLKGIWVRNQFYDRERIGQWGFFELGAYLSPAAVALAVLGILGRLRSSLPWLLAGALFFVLAIGDPQPWYPWALLHRLPVFSLLRVPARFLMPFGLTVGVIAGFGADFLGRDFRKLGVFLGSALLAIAVFDAWLVNRPNLNAPIDGSLPSVSWSPQFRQFHNSDPWGALGVNLTNTGAMNCNEEMDFHEPSHVKVTGYNQPHYRGEYYLLGPGSLVLRRWTPNALSYDVVTPAASVAVINQNYDSNWRLARGRGVVFSQDGLIAVRVPAGAQHLRLVYRSNAFRIGAVISLLTCLLALALWRRERHRTARPENG